MPVRLGFRADTASRPGGFRLHLNGSSLHFRQDEDTNEANWGLGFERSLARREGLLSEWTTHWELDAYKDSNSQMGVAGGIGARRPVTSWLSLGLKGGLVYENGLENNWGSPLIPYILPFLELGPAGLVSLRATLVPPLAALNL